jgi:RAD51-like protein 2
MSPRVSSFITLKPGTLIFCVFRQVALLSFSRSLQLSQVTATMKLEIPLAHLPLKPSTLKVFHQRGFVSAREIECSKASGMSNLAAELAVSLQNAATFYRELQQCLDTNSPTTTAVGVLASELINENNGALLNNSIISFCRAVDVLLAGGIALGEVTEVSGAPGAGKTQWATQLCVNTRLPMQFGGVAGEAVYIDTEGSFSPERCLAMATALCSHIDAGRRRRTATASQRDPLPEWFTPESILAGIHVFRVHDEAAQTAVIGALPKFLDEKQGAIKLIVIDSMAFHFRASGPDTDFVQRTRLLTRLATGLAELAAQQQVAVVAVNQMTTKFGSARDLRMVPALGESWAHAVTTRLLLAENEGVRQCELTKSPRLAAGKADYVIVEEGVRGSDFARGDRKRQKMTI